MNKLITQLLFLVSIVFFSCQDGKEKGYVVYEGETMGTYYRITFNNNGSVKKENVDEILEKYNRTHSTYLTNSYITLFNESKQGIAIPSKDTFFFPVFEKAQKWHKITNGAYDPTIYDLINYWGFGPDRRKVDLKDPKVRKQVNKFLNNKGMNDIFYTVGSDGFQYLQKRKPGIKLDFSSIAKGNVIDVIANYFEKNKINSYLVDVGGEARSKGFNAQNKIWTLGINTPDEEAKTDSYETIVSLDDMSIATSGNYRNVYESNGRKISHTINAKTGYPERNNVLSASVLADNCTDADAIATCVMALGLKDAKKLLAETPGVEALIIYDGDGKGEFEKYYTKGFKKYIVK